MCMRGTAEGVFMTALAVLLFCEQGRGTAAKAEVTKEVVDEGLVQAHVELAQARGVWIAMPVTITVEVGGRTVTVSLSYEFSVGEVGVNARQQFRSIVRDGRHRDFV